MAALIDPFGRVFNSVTGIGVDGVTVTLIDAATGLPATVYGDDGISTFPATITQRGTAADSSGRIYTFSGRRLPVPVHHAGPLPHRRCAARELSLAVSRAHGGPAGAPRRALCDRRSRLAGRGVHRQPGALRPYRYSHRSRRQRAVAHQDSGQVLRRHRRPGALQTFRREYGGRDPCPDRIGPRPSPGRIPVPERISDG